MYFCQIAAWALLFNVITGLPTCRDVYIDADIVATNFALPTSLDPATLESYLLLSAGSLATVNATGTYKIYGSYCTPEVVNSNKKTLQLLVHGAASSHHYWQGDNYNGTSYHGDQYSWAAYASKAGYPTLAIDRLGHGRSEHPDTSIVQLPAQVEITHSLIQQIKSGVLGTTVSEVVYVGHSLGSILGQIFTAKYPDDCQRVILTGWATVATETLIAATVGGSGQALVFYGYGSPFAGKFYDPYLPALDLANPGENPPLEGITMLLLIETFAAAYRGNVLALTGQRDAYWCGPNVYADCGQGPTGIVARAKRMYPNAKHYDYDVLPDTGHANILHYSSRVHLQYGQDWLTSVA